MLDPILKHAYDALESNLTDQDISKQCSSLSAEDIHAIRQTKADISLLPYVALVELSHIGKEKAKATILNSPIQEKEYAIFKERLAQHFRFFKEQQEAKFNSEQSQMDDLLVAKIMDDVKADLLKDESELLSYFKWYQQEIIN